MKPIARDEILGLAEYEAVRVHFRARVIAEKKVRRISLGSKASAVFENRDTVLLQIQEMLRTERITRPAAVLHEIETYSELLPADDELSCTLMVEIADKGERDAFLQAAKGLERHVWLVTSTARLAARAIGLGAAPALPDEIPDRTTAVHYLKFPLPPEVAESLRSPDSSRALALNLALQIDHPAYAVRTGLPASTIEALREDFVA